MRRLIPLLVLMACVSTNAAPPVPHAPRAALTVTGPLLVPGDTLRYTLNWTVGANAAGYIVIVRPSATNGTWTGWPNQAGTTGLSMVITGSAIPWDSVTLTAVVHGTRAGVISKDSAMVTWTARKAPHSPSVPPTVDSSATVTGLVVEPPSITVSAGSSQQAGAFIVFADGHVAERTVDKPIIDSLYRRVFTATQRAVTVLQQRCADTSGYCYNAASGWQKRWLDPVRYSFGVPAR